MGLAMGTYGLTHGNESEERVSDSKHISNDDNGRIPSLEVCARGRADFNGQFCRTGPLQTHGGGLLGGGGALHGCHGIDLDGVDPDGQDHDHAVPCGVTM